MGAPDLTQVLSLISAGPMVTALILILWMGSKRKWVWGYQLAELRADYEERLQVMSADRDAWKALATEGVRLADRGADLADKAVSLRHEPKEVKG